MTQDDKQIANMQIEMQKDAIQEIKEAIKLIQEAQEKVEYALQYHRDLDSYEAYGKYGFDQLLGNGNPYDSSLHSLIKTSEEHIAELIEESK